MNRLTLIFLALLALATASGGIAFQNAASLVAGNGGILNALAFAMCAVVFGFAMIVLARIVQLTARWGN